MHHVFHLQHSKTRAGPAKGFKFTSGLLVLFIRSHSCISVSNGPQCSCLTESLRDFLKVSAVYIVRSALHIF